MSQSLTVNVELEQQFLGGLMRHNDVFVTVAGIVSADDFTEPLHAQMFTLIAALLADGREATPVTLKSYITDGSLNVDGGGLPGEPNITVGVYLTRLYVNGPPPNATRDAARLLADLGARRDLMSISSDAAALATEAPVDASAIKIIDAAVERMITLRDRVTPEDEAPSVEATFDELIDITVARREGREDPAMRTGLAALDKQLGGGLRGGRLYVFAGRPGSGKTALKANLLTRLSREGHACIDFSLEIDRKESWARLAAAEMSRSSNSPPYSEILSGGLYDDQLHMLREAKTRLAGRPIKVDETPGLSAAQIEARAQRATRVLEKHGRRLRVIAVDYLQLMKMTDRYKGNGVSELGEAVLHLKNMAKRMDAAVVLLSQLSRAVESREDKHPHLNDLRGSGNIEEHADAVGLIYRPAYYDNMNPNPTSEELEVAAARANDLQIGFDKNRLGPTGGVTLFCDVGRCLIDNKSSY